MGSAGFESSNPANPAVSVVVPVYNKASTIERTLKSIQQQTFTDFEVLVVDDGSKDDSAAIAARINDERFRVVQQPNAGEGAARNRGIRESRAELIALLDGDDEWEPEFLEAVTDLARRYPEAGLLAAGYRRNYAGQFERETTVAPAGSSTTCRIDDYFRCAMEGDFVTSSSVAIRRRVFGEVGMLLEGEPIGADRELWARIALKYPFAYDSRILATYYTAPATGAHHAVGLQPPFPPVVREVRRVLATAEVPNGQAQDLVRYLDCRLFHYADLLLDKRNRSGLSAVLKTEKFLTAKGHLKASCYRAAVAALPLWAVSALRVRSQALIEWLEQRIRRVQVAKGRLPYAVVQRLVPTAPARRVPS